MLTDDLLDFDDDDLVIINKQESIFLTQLNSCQTGSLDIPDTRAELNILQGRLTAATQELALISSEKVAKDGEVAMLRAKLSALESEKFEASKRHAAKLEALQQERQSLIAHWQREIERLQTELKFQKSETISAHEPTWPDQGMQGDSFTGFFPDLIGNDIPKRPRTSRMIFEEFSCEVDFLVEPVESMFTKPRTDSILRLDLLGILLKSMGCADQVIAHEDILEKDRELIAKIREDIHDVAFNTQNALLPVEYYFRKLSLASSHVLTHYILTILEFFVCMNEPIGPMILMGNTEFAEEALNKTANLVGDKEPILGQKTQLLQYLCEYLRKLPQGRGHSVVHQLLRIIKHVVYKTTRDAPSCVLALLDDGVLLDKLDSFHQDYDEITLDIAQLIQLIGHDARVPTLVFKQIPSHGCSLLDLFNDIVADKLEESEYQKEISEELDLVITFLEGFVASRIFPASVAFEPRTLRLFARELARITHNRQNLDVSRRGNDVQRLLKIMNLVALTEKAPIVKLLDHEIFCLMSAVLKISDEGQFPKIKPLIKDLKCLLDQEYLDIKQGRYSLVPIPIVRRRVKPLTEDEELAMYEEMKQSTLINS